MENDTEEMVAVFSSSNHDAEMEATTIKGVLEASGVPAMLVGPHVLPNLEFQVQVSRELAEKAEAVITEARAAGPAAAAEAEALSEE
jgi:uridine phosphorylase